MQALIASSLSDGTGVNGPYQCARFIANNRRTQVRPAVTEAQCPVFLAEAIKHMREEIGSDSRTAILERHFHSRSRLFKRQGPIVFTFATIFLPVLRSAMQVSPLNP